MHILEDLKFRGLLNQFTDFDILYQRLEKPCVLYCGFDATADSLHIGNLLPLVCLKRFQQFGHKAIAVLGNGTSLVGDPSGKTSERTLNSIKTIKIWAKSIKKQLKQFFGNSNYRLVSNYEWLGKIKFLEFIRDIGKHFPLGYMLDKESVRSRIEAGISFTEFAYMLLQAYDFLILNKKYNCELQIGGSDQWGNITAGIDLIRRIEQKQTFGLTIPLVMKSDGSKFGKTETDTIWLDAKKTSAYQFYQFWINTDDKDVIRFIKYFTFLAHEEILRIEKEEVLKNPQNRVAQRVLAQEMTRMIHGEKGLKKAEELTNALFGGEIKNLSEKDIEEVFRDMPYFETKKQRPIDLISLLVDAKVSESRRQAKEDIETNAIHTYEFNKYLIIRKGKKNYFLVKWG
jgi:tyrosyl-tRNA synthetase